MKILIVVEIKIEQESWEDLDSEEEKKDVEKAADAPKAKPKPKKKVAEKIEEREVNFRFIRKIFRIKY